jgi:preprotein translocase subunit SecE
VSAFEIYKRGQGKYTRSVTFIAVVGIGVVGAGVLSNKISGYTPNPYIIYGIPSLLVAALAALMFWVVNRPSSADFMILTESEMKKVSWSSRKEIIGSTKVVIVTTFILALILFGVDILFIRLFSWMNIIA